MIGLIIYRSNKIRDTMALHYMKRAVGKKKMPILGISEMKSYALEILSIYFYNQLIIQNINLDLNSIGITNMLNDMQAPQS